MVAVAHALLQRVAADNAAAAGVPSAPSPPLLLIGHSMGGSVAARVAAAGALPTLCGVAVLDIVEGTAQAALPAMRTLLAQRPRGFVDVAAARAWARAPPGPSLPSQLVLHADGSAVTWRTPLHLTEPFWEGWFRCVMHTRAARMFGCVADVAVRSAQGLERHFPRHTSAEAAPAGGHGPAGRHAHHRADAGA